MVIMNSKSVLQRVGKHKEISDQISQAILMHNYKKYFCDFLVIFGILL